MSFYACLFVCPGSACNPFQIPKDFITTDGSKRRPVQTPAVLAKRLARLSQAELSGKDPSREASALFSFAQRRQEQQLREALRRTKSRRGKEMTWEVAHLKWRRWAKRHPNLAR